MNDLCPNLKVIHVCVYVCVVFGSPRLSCHHGIEFRLCLQLMFVQRFSQLDPLDLKASETTLLKALFMPSHLLSFHLVSYVLLSFPFPLSHIPFTLLFSPFVSSPVIFFPLFLFFLLLFFLFFLCSVISALLSSLFSLSSSVLFVSLFFYTINCDNSFYVIYQLTASSMLSQIPC